MANKQSTPIAVQQSNIPFHCECICIRIYIFFDTCKIFTINRNEITLGSEQWAVNTLIGSIEITMRINKFRMYPSLLHSLHWTLETCELSTSAVCVYARSFVEYAHYTALVGNSFISSFFFHSYICMFLFLFLLKSTVENQSTSIQQLLALRFSVISRDVKFKATDNSMCDPSY